MMSFTFGAAVESMLLWATGLGMLVGGVVAAGGFAFTVLGALGRPVDVRASSGVLAAGLALVVVAGIFYVLAGGALIIGPIAIGGR